MQRLSLPFAAPAAEMVPAPRPRQALRGPVNELHLAARAGFTKRTLALLSAGLIDINQGDPRGMTPIMEAVIGTDSFRVVEILVDHGACVLLVNDKGISALCLACMSGNLAATELLLRAGADPDAGEPQGYTPLHFAATWGYSQVVSALIEAGADPDKRFRRDRATPLYIAAGYGFLDAVRVLLQANANALLPRTESGFDFVPLDNAARGGHLAVVRELLQQRGIEGCGGPTTGIYALILSMISGVCSPRMARMFVDAGVSGKSTARIPLTTGTRGLLVSVLDYATDMLREKKVGEEDATEEQLNGLGGIRRLLLQEKAVHAVSWLWPANPAFIVRAADCVRKTKAVSTPLRTMLLTLRRRAAMPKVLLGPVFRYSVKL